MSKWDPPRREVTQTKPLAELDERAQIRAASLRAKYGWEIYTYLDGPVVGGRYIVGANLPTTDDTREWFRVIFDEKGEG